MAGRLALGATEERRERRLRKVTMQEEKVVHFRSQKLHAAAPPDLESAFQAFMPQCKDFMSSDKELWKFLCSLRHEFSPVILRSKDVYGYNSCRAVVPSPDQLSTGSSRSAKKSRSTPASAAPPAKRKRGSCSGAAKKRSRDERKGGSSGGDELETSSERDSPALVPPPPPVYMHFGKSLEEIWKAATPRCPSSFPSVRVDDVSQADDLAAARRQAQDVLQINLEPVVLVRRFPVPSL